MAKFSFLKRSGVLVAVSLVFGVWAGARGVKSWTAPEDARKLKNPVPATPESLAAAKTIYLDRCARCHGEEGKGDGPEAPMYSVKASDLTDAHVMGDTTEGEIFWKISEGRPPMPSFKKQLSEEQRWQLVNFLRTLVPRPAPVSKPSRDKKSQTHKH